MRRRGRSKTRYSESTNADQAHEPMDEDDQESLVASLEREAATQTRFFHAIFGFGIGGMAVVYSMMLPFLCPEECKVDDGTAVACWLHSVYSSGVHIRSIYPFLFKTSLIAKPTPISMDIALQMIPILLWFTGFISKDEDYLHLALILGNMITFFGARLMYWDIQSTKISLENLDAARYKHKNV